MTAISSSDTDDSSYEVGFMCIHLGVLESKGVAVGIMWLSLFVIEL